jgi:hypothetical protein
VTVEAIAIDDAINVVNVIAECETPDADADQRELALAARRLVREVREQAAELERERARRRSLPLREAPAVNGASLGNGFDGGGWRQFLAGRPIHAGDTLYLLTTLGWHVVRYESNAPRKSSFLYLSLPCVRDDVVVPVPREARFAWPDELN